MEVHQHKVQESVVQVKEFVLDPKVVIRQEVHPVHQVHHHQVALQNQLLQNVHLVLDLDLGQEDQAAHNDKNNEKYYKY